MEAKKEIFNLGDHSFLDATDPVRGLELLERWLLEGKDEDVLWAIAEIQHHPDWQKAKAQWTRIQCDILISIGKAHQALEVLKSFNEKGGEGLTETLKETKMRAQLMLGQIADVKDQIRTFYLDPEKKIKWNQIVNAVENDSEALSPLTRDIAVAIPRMVRKFEPELFARLYFETRSRVRREFLLTMFGEQQGAFQERYQFQIGKNPQFTLDFFNREIVAVNKVKLSIKICLLLSKLAVDIKRPKKLEELLGDFEPGAKSYSKTQLNGFNQLVHRTRLALKKSGGMLEIRCESDGYVLDCAGDYKVIFAADPSMDLNSVLFRKLKFYFSMDTIFSSKEACRKLATSRSSFLRLINWGISQGVIVTEGEKRHRTYRWAEASES